MINRVVTITGDIEALGDKINYFIKNDLKENEYVINIKYMENGRRLKPYEKNQGIDFDIVVVAIIHIGELKQCDIK